MVSDRYHAVVLRTPAQVRSAVRYVLLNARRHAAQRKRKLSARVRLDPASSARWFTGWSWRPRGEEEPPGIPSPTSAPRTWLLAIGWRRRGLIDPSDVPGRMESAQS